jgi:hypothetical protein
MLYLFCKGNWGLNKSLTKYDMIKTLNLAILIAACSVAIGAHAATTITLTVDPNLPPGTSPFVLGAAIPGAPASPADEVIYITGILALPLGGTGTAGADTIYRSLNVFSPLSAPTIPASPPFQGVSGTGTTFVDQGYTYLAAKYDGPNGGTEVWYLGGVASGTSIVIPANAFGTANNQYGLSGWNFFTATRDNPNFPPQGSVPDGGSTFALLGCALVGAESLRRKMHRS